MTADALMWAGAVVLLALMLYGVVRPIVGMFRMRAALSPVEGCWQRGYEGLFLAFI